MEQQNRKIRRTYYVRSFLPDYLLIEILLRTPASSVIRFKSMCKQWYSVIRDPDFIREHFDRLQKNPSISFAFLYYSWYNFVHLLTTFEDEEELKLNRVDGHKPMVSIPEKESVNFLGAHMVACKGLLCIYSWSIHICNPTTQELVTLPRQAIRTSIKGFGYDSVSRQYKVVQLLSQHSINRESPVDVILFVFTLGNTSWRTVSFTAKYNDFAFPNGSGSNGLGRHVDGSIYWFITKHGYKKYTSILCFDVRDETFKDIKLPVGYKFLDDSRESMLVELNENQLGIVKHYHEHHIIDIWVLREDLTQDPWTKEYRLDVSSINDVYPYWYLISNTPMRFTGGKLLFTTAKCLVSYDLQDSKIEQVYESSSGDFMAVDIYMQTMISLYDMAW